MLQYVSASGEGLKIKSDKQFNHFPHTTNLQQTTRQIYGKFLEMKVLLLNTVENIVTKGEIAHYEQLLFCHNIF